MNGRSSCCALMLSILVSITAPAAAVVNYDTGRLEIDGVQLLQDHHDPARYYYIPQYPRLATKEDGTLELLAIKYVDASGGASGGLFHALVEFTLPDDVVAHLQAELEARQPGATIVGAVPLLEATEDGDDGVGSFRIISSVLSDTGEEGLTRSLITSGRSPLMPGSRAVVAARLNQHGATLLWDSLTAPTSDVSVAVRGYYEAMLPAYHATVFAEMSTIYEHFSEVSNFQDEYKKDQIRDIVDELHRDGILDVSVTDRSDALGIDSGDLDRILNLVTDKLTELMFDYQAGWSADPAREAAVEQGQIKGRQSRGFIRKLFGGAHDSKYYTDDQYVLKKRQDIRHNTFRLNLSRASAIRVPVETAGNLGGLYEAMGEDDRYFRIVDLNDAHFETREVHFQVDGDFLQAFKDTINFVSVKVRRTYEERPPQTWTVHFSYDEVQAGQTVQSVTFPRLDATGGDWRRYEYQVRWGLRSGPTLTIPAGEDGWLEGNDAIIALTPPFRRRLIDVDVVPEAFETGAFASAVVEFATVRGGEPILDRRVTFRASDSEWVKPVTIYHDPDAPIACRVTWHAPGREVRGDMQVLESDYVFVSPPEGGGP